jgi:hypothetical protein
MHSPIVKLFELDVPQGYVQESVAKLQLQQH